MSIWFINLLQILWMLVAAGLSSAVLGYCYLYWRTASRKRKQAARDARTLVLNEANRTPSPLWVRKVNRSLEPNGHWRLVQHWKDEGYSNMLSQEAAYFGQGYHYVRGSSIMTLEELDDAWERHTEFEDWQEL